MGAECSCKITPSKGICTWLAMGFPGTTTLPDNKSRFLTNFAKGSVFYNIASVLVRNTGQATAAFSPWVEACGEYMKMAGRPGRTGAAGPAGHLGKDRA